MNKQWPWWLWLTSHLMIPLSSLAATGSVTTLEHQAEVYLLKFSSDGQFLASVSYDNTIKLWDVQSGQLHQQLDKHQGWISSIAFSPQGTLLASGSDDKTVKIWQVASGNVLHDSWQGDAVSAISFSPQGQWLASGGDNGIVKIWEVDTGWIQHSLRDHQGRIDTLAFQPQSQWLASSGKDNTIKLWDVVSGQLKSQLEHQSRVSSFTFAAEGHWLAVHEGYAQMTLWQLKPLKQRHSLPGLGQIAFSPNGVWLAANSTKNAINIWDVHSGQLWHALGENVSGLSPFAFSPTQDRLALSLDNKSNTIQFLDIISRQIVDTLKGHQGRVNVLTFSPEGQWLASASRDETVKLWALSPASQSESMPSKKIVETKNSERSLATISQEYHTQKRAYQTQLEHWQHTQDQLTELRTQTAEQHKNSPIEAQADENFKKTTSKFTQLKQQLSAAEQQMAIAKAHLDQIATQVEHLGTELIQAQFQQLKQHIEQERQVLIRAEVLCAPIETDCQHQAEQAAQHQARQQGLALLINSINFKKIFTQFSPPQLADIESKVQTASKGLLLGYEVLEQGQQQHHYFFHLKATIKGHLSPQLKAYLNTL
ncbi:MAG: hypothetical protein SVR94_14935 [Pseudomonadota bacterium]|nr:hypothetical protein [Pseudomonadota bacterium]